MYVHELERSIHNKSMQVEARKKANDYPTNEDFDLEANMN